MNVDFSIAYEDLKKMPILDELNFHNNGEIFIENQDTLIKAIPDDINKMISFLIDMPSHSHIIKPKEIGTIVYSSSVKKKDMEYKSCYRMDYLENAHNLYSFNKANIPYSEKLKYTKQFFEALKFLHQYLVLGDIHAKNLFIANENAYIGDLDNARDKEHWACEFSAYYISKLKWLGSSKYTDIIKMYLECLSFILGIRFMGYIQKYGYKEFYKTLTSYHLPEEVSSFLKYCKHPNHLKPLGEEAYDFEQFITEDVLSLKKTLSFFDYYE